MLPVLVVLGVLTVLAVLAGYGVFEEGSDRENNRKQN